MPLLLTSPKSTGDLDPNTTEYAWVKIIHFSHNPMYGNFKIVCHYGNDDGYGNWVSGILPSSTYIIINKDGNTDYTDIVTTIGQDGVPTYKKGAQHLYQWLVDKGHCDGSYVDTN